MIEVLQMLERAPRLRTGVLPETSPGLSGFRDRD